MAPAAIDGRPWTARLMAVEVAGLAALAQDPDRDLLSDVAFPEPVLSNPELSRRFLRLHTALQTASTRLERDEHLAEWLSDFVDLHAAQRPRSRPRPRITHDDRALRLALQYLADRAEPQHRP